MTEVQFSYRPRAQFIPFHQREKRWSCIVAHRRAGKTVACINEIIARGSYTAKKNARYAYIAPFYRQAKDTAWTYLKEFAGDAAKKVSESELSVTLFNNAKITLYGADNPDALRGIYLDGVVLDEFGDCRPSLWGKVVLPTLADRKGWAVFIGTPKGNNHFYDIYRRSKAEDGWFSLTLKASETGILGEEELREMRAQMTEEEYDQEFECSFEAAVLGTYYTKQIIQADKEGRITKIPWDPDFPVEVATDLGFSDSCAWWFWQYRPDGVAMIDYEEHDGQKLEFYYEMLDAKGFEYEKVWLPHDARAKTLQTGRSTVEQFLEQERYPVEIGARLAVQHGIDAARYMIPKVWFDRDRCYDGIEALKAYRRKYDEVSKSFSDKPQHDWASNGADAFRYFSLVAKQRIVGRTDTIEQSSFLIKAPEFQLEKLFAENEVIRPGRFSRRVN